MSASKPERADADVCERPPDWVYSIMGLFVGGVGDNHGLTASWTPVHSYHKGVVDTIARLYRAGLLPEDSYERLGGPK